MVINKILPKLVMLYFFLVACGSENSNTLSNPTHAAMKYSSLVQSSSISEYFNSHFGLDLGNIYWDEFHTHTTYSLSLDATLLQVLRYDVYSPEEACEYARDVQNLSFASLNDHAEEPNLVALQEYPTISSLSVWDSVNGINQR